MSQVPVHLNKGREGYMVPLTWIAVKRHSGGHDTAIIVCRNGHGGSIDDHNILEDGAVTPSVVCTQRGCSWHEFIKLDGWPNRWGKANGKGQQMGRQK